MPLTKPRARRDADLRSAPIKLALAPSTAPLMPSREWLRLARLAKSLAWASLGWLTVEGTVGVIAGLAAGSIALIGFGLDSAIEGLASVIVVWRFTGTRTRSPNAEIRAQKLVAVSFFLLAPYVAVESLRTLLVEHHAETSLVGIALTGGTLAICPGLGIAKQKIGDRLGSPATKGEGKQNLLCAWLAAGVLAGLLANTTLGLWWLDPAVGLAIAGACLLAGRQTWRGQGCSCTDCTIPTPPTPSESSNPTPSRVRTRRRQHQVDTRSEQTPTLGDGEVANRERRRCYSSRAVATCSSPEAQRSRSRQ